jgi:MATE family multidrug resistance protein
VEKTLEGLERGDGEERLKRKVAHGAHVHAAGRPNRELERAVPRTAVTREVFDLAWPIATAMLGESALRLVDTKLVGALGAAPLGGVGLATVLAFLAYSLSQGAMRGVNVRVAHAIGEGRPEDGFAFARAGLVLSATFGVVVLVACRNVTPLLVLLDANAEILPYARDFLAAVTLGAPATCALVALNQHCQATGDSRTPMVIGISGNLVNALFAWSLIYGHLGLPALGVRGAGYATAATEVLEFGVMFAIFRRREKRACMTIGSAKLPLRSAIREVVDLGVPTGVHFTAEMLAFTLFTVVLGTISKEEIAAHQIAVSVIRTSFLPGVAVGEATAVLVGRALGARRPSEADAIVRGGLRIAVSFMAACGLVFALFGGILGRFFSPDPSVVARVRVLFFVAAVFQILDAVNIVLRGALRGAKDVRAAMVMGILIVWSCVPTSAYVLGKLGGLGALGGWIGFVAETTLAATLFWWRWKRGPWRTRAT